MEAYRDRIAERVRREAAKRGESAPDLAHALSVYPTTAERWLRGERTPQRRHRKALAEHWEIPFEDLEPDLAAEEREINERLERIELAIGEIGDVVSSLDARLRAAEIGRRADEDPPRSQGDQPEAGDR